MSLLAQIAIFLAAAVIAIPIFRRFKLGSVLGYLTAGIIIGPASLGLISSVETTQNIAQFGIVLLMFVIGLELQPSRLWVLRRSIFGLGSAQVAATAACWAARSAPDVLRWAMEAVAAAATAGGNAVVKINPGAWDRWRGRYPHNGRPNRCR